jgi:hypothetical protein
MDISKQFYFKVDKVVHISSTKGHVSRFMISLFSVNKESEFSSSPYRGFHLHKVSVSIQKPEVNSVRMCPLH